MSFKSPWLGVGRCTDSFHYSVLREILRERARVSLSGGGFSFFFRFGVCLAVKIFSEKYPWLEHFLFSRNLQDATQESVKGKNNCLKSNASGGSMERGLGRKHPPGAVGVRIT